MSKRLTVGMRARIKNSSSWATGWGYGGKEVLLVERSGGDFSVMLLGQKELIKKDPNTVVNELAWLTESDLEFVDADFDTNLAFIDWYQENQDDFCPDCGAWFPDRGRLDESTGEDYLCPNEKCPGNEERDE